MNTDKAEQTTQSPSNSGLKSIWQWPFLTANNSGLAPIMSLVLSAREDAHEGHGDSQRHHTLHLVDEGLVKLLARLDGAPAADDADFDLDEANAGWLQNDVVLDWGDEYESAGLSFAALRNLKQVKPDTWQLADGRFVRFYFAQRASLAPATAKAATEPLSALQPNSLAQAMADRYAGGDLWGQHPRYSHQDWKTKVENDDTLTGYWDWVRHALDANEEDAGAGTVCVQLPLLT